jgi:uncharacterized protein YchJ
MRSRYTAYFAHDVRYIMATTDPEGPHFNPDGACWRRELLAFCRATEFLGLKVVEVVEDGDRAHVTFEAKLGQGAQTVPMRERSLFVRVKGRWLYRAAD